MEKCDVLLADDDVQFAVRLNRYVRRSDLWQRRVNIRFASTKESLHDLLRDRKPDVLLVCPAWREAAVTADVKCLAILSAEKEQPVEGKIPCLAKYQPIPSILEFLLTLGEKKTDKSEMIEGTRELAPRIVAVYSATGGVGKSTLCLHLLRAWQRERRNAVYVNLESVSSQQWYGSSGEWTENASRLFYKLQHEPTLFQQHWQQAIRQHPTFAFDTFPPFNHVLDGVRLSAEDAIFILQTLKKSGNYDLVLVDLDSGCNERMIGAFRAADDIVWLEPGDAIGQDKSERMKQALTEIWGEEAGQVNEKIRLVRHRSLSSGEAVIPNSASWVASLPYIAEWKQVQGWNHIWHHDTYATAVQQLHRTLWRKAG